MKKNLKSGGKSIRVNQSVLENFVTVLKTSEEWYSNFNLRDITLISSAFRDSYNKIQTTSESFYTLKRLSNDLNKLVKS